jgi:hypothetical protein
MFQHIKYRLFASNMAALFQANFPLAYHVSRPTMQVGDLVVRTYGEGQRPRALIVGWYKPSVAEVIWLGTDEVQQFAKKYLEMLNASR